MQSIRREAVAGMFYSADPKRLQDDVSRFLAMETTVGCNLDTRAVVVPHAGYMYSGSCAAVGYNAVRNLDFDTAVILAPSHHSNQFIFSHGKYSHYSTPLGNVPVNQEWLTELDGYEEFQFSAFAHEKEHSLEVQLPFLQVIKPDIKIVPIILGRQSLENSRKLATILRDVQNRRNDRIMFIISTDLSHYHTQKAAEKMDKTLQRDMALLSENALQQDISNHTIEACGIGGLFFLLAWSHFLTSPGFRTLQYSHSGMVNLDTEQVVGYMAGVLTGGM